MNLERLLAKQFDKTEITLTDRDAILYSLGIGIGSNPISAADLQYTYEKDLKVFPAMVNVIAHQNGWMMDPELEIDWLKMLHGEEYFEILKPLETGKTYYADCSITDVLDKGEGKGLLLYFERLLREKTTNEIVAIIRMTLFLRGDGGSGGTTKDARPIHQMPQRAADKVIILPTLAQSALIYRLSGDYNPIHINPELAKKSGFEKPILHGLCSLGITTRAVIDACCELEPERLAALQLRFSSPVYPGETISTEIWIDNNEVSFRSKVIERDLLVLNNGLAKIKD